MSMWSFTLLTTTLGAAIGAAIMPTADEPGSAGFGLFVAGIEGVAGGAMLAMLAQTALPEAVRT